MSPTMPTPTDLTRQQLDELDVLLQRMLNLPLNAPPAEPTPVAANPSIRLPAGWRADPPPTPKPPHVEEADEEVFAPAMAVSLSATATARPFLPEPPTAGPLRGVDAPALPTGYVSPLPEPAPAPPPVEVAYEEVAPISLAPANEVPTPSGRVPVLLWPLFAVNWMMELLLGLFGPVGTIITYPAVKHLLGVAGLGLMAGAAAWSARGMGWVSW